METSKAIVIMHNTSRFGIKYRGLIMRSIFVFLIFILFPLSVPAELTDNGDGTITDTNKNLMWQKYSSSSLLRSQATVYIEQLNWDKYSNWRYPTSAEFLDRYWFTFGCYWYNNNEIGICFTSYGFDYAFIQSGKVFAVRNIEQETITYTQEELDQAILQERLKWDVGDDGKIGLPEAIRALQIVSGLL